jgi:hypothetical protein
LLKILVYQEVPTGSIIGFALFFSGVYRVSAGCNVPIKTKPLPYFHESVYRTKDHPVAAPPVEHSAYWVYLWSCGLHTKSRHGRKGRYFSCCGLVRALVVEGTSGKALVEKAVICTANNLVKPIQKTNTPR